MDIVGVHIVQAGDAGHGDLSHRAGGGGLHITGELDGGLLDDLDLLGLAVIAGDAVRVLHIGQGDDGAVHSVLLITGSGGPGSSRDINRVVVNIQSVVFGAPVKVSPV